jgi:hypothetical protein
MSTMLLIFVLQKGSRGGFVLKEFLLASGLALLLSAVFWVPFAHFLPEFGKPIDTSYSASQSIEYIPLNFIIQDADFYRIDTLDRILFPAIYMNYIGWLPALFAFYALISMRKAERRVLLTLLGGIAVVFIASSTNFIQILARILPDLAASFRYPPMLLGLTVPLILGLAGAGLDRILRLPWPRFQVPWQDAKLAFPSLALLVLLAWSVKSSYDFSRQWLVPFSPPPDTKVLEQKFTTDTAQWVQPPNHHYWMPDLLASQKKITGVFRPWWFSGRDAPNPFLEAIPEEEWTGDLTPIDSVNTIQIVARPTNQYAVIETPDGPIPCQAISRGGNIDVSCDSPSPGILTVTENSWTGWKVAVDGEPGQLRSGNWLSVAAPEGQHEFTFRYRPLDAYLGFALAISGVLLTAWLWRRSRRFPDSY